MNATNVLEQPLILERAVVCCPEPATYWAAPAVCDRGCSGYPFMTASLAIERVSHKR